MWSWPRSRRRIASRTPISGEHFVTNCRHRLAGASVVEMSRRRFSFTVGQLAAAAVLLIAVSGWFTFPFPGTPDVADEVADYDSTVSDAAFDRVPVSDLAAARMDDAGHDAGSRISRQTLDDNRARLDPATVKLVEEDCDHRARP